MRGAQRVKRRRQCKSGPGARTDHDHGLDLEYGGNFDLARRQYQSHNHSHAQGFQHGTASLTNLVSDGHHGRAGGDGSQ